VQLFPKVPFESTVRNVSLVYRKIKKEDKSYIKVTPTRV